MKTYCLRTGIVAAAMAATFTAMSADYVPKIIAGVVKMDSWTTASAQKEGIYQLEAVAGGSLTQLSEGRDVYMAPLGGAVYVDGKMKGIHFRTIEDSFNPSGYSYAIYSVEYDMKTWTQTKRKSLGDLYGNLISSCGVTHDPVTGNDYGIFFNFDMNYNVIDRKFCTIDYDKEIPSKSVICVMTEQFSAIAAGENGRLYGVSREGYLYTINKTNGNLTLIGDLGVSDISANPSSMTFDPRTGKLYWCYVSTANKSYLYEINYEIGSVGATRIMQIPDNAVLVNMHIAAPEADDAAPAAVTGLAADFPGESYTGTVSFTLPSKAYDESPLAGDLDYTIYANGQSVATGSGAAGSAVSKQITVTGGDTEIKVVASNGAGTGAPESVTLYIGHDVPHPVKTLKFSYDDASQNATVTWRAPQKGTHGKDLDATNLRYRVVRQPGSVTVAAAHSGTSITDRIANDGQLKSYWYEVTPINGTLSGETTATNKIAIGRPVSLPYTERFTTDNGFDVCTVIDANNDGATWYRYHYESDYSGTSNHARMDADNENADDDWLLLPPMELRKGAVYTLFFDAKKQFLTSDCLQRLEVAVGRGGDVAAYSMIMSPFDIDNVNFAEYGTRFTVAEDGVYHIGFHAISNAASAALDIDRVAVAIETSADAPAAVTGLKVTPDASGALAATATFTAPTETLAGTALDAITRVEATDAAGKVIGTLRNPAPGSACTMELGGMQNGMNTITVRAVKGSDKGAVAQVEVFIGQDVPMPPTNIKLADNGTRAILTWDAPTSGANGHQVNPATVKYNLYIVDEVFGYLTTVAEDIKSPYDLGIDSDKGAQNLIYYAMRAETIAGESETVPTNSLLVGAPYGVPFVQSFANAEWGEYYSWIEGEKADWNIGLTRDLSQDGDGGSVAFIPNMADFGIFNTGKISPAGCAAPVLSFWCYVYPGTTSYLSVAVDKFPQGQAETLKTVRYADEQQEGWKQVFVDLSKYKAEPFVIVKFSMASASKAAPIVIDNIRIGEGTGIQSVTGDTGGTFDVYSIDGRTVRRHAASTEGLDPGFYIINGRRVLIPATR